MTKAHLLLLSAYRADSHGAWADRLVRAHPEFEWSRLELPGRHFRWRIRGNPLSWLDRMPERPPDMIVATSMVDLATLRGLHPVLTATPAVYYFHENQFAYPVSDRQVDSVDPQMVQLYGALAAERVAFNSAFNRDSFLEGVDALLARMPDHVPSGVARRLREKSRICPVPIDPIAPAARRDERLIVWNHRWEYDKNPDLFAHTMLDLAGRGIDFRLALLGPRPRTGGTAALQRLRSALGERIVADGQLEATQYHAVLARAGLVVSTARHEFQGLAMLEAASAGARPLVPDTLCYPEQYPPACHYPAGDVEALATRLQHWLTCGLPPPVDVSAWHPDTLNEAWRRLLAPSAGA